MNIRTVLVCYFQWTETTNCVIALSLKSRFRLSKCWYEYNVIRPQNCLFVFVFVSVLSCSTSDSIEIGICFEKKIKINKKNEIIFSLVVIFKILSRNNIDRIQCNICFDVTPDCRLEFQFIGIYIIIFYKQITNSFSIQQ